MGQDTNLQLGRSDLDISNSQLETLGHSADHVLTFQVRC